MIASVRTIVGLFLVVSLGSQAHAWQPPAAAYPYPYPNSRPVYQAPRYYPPPGRYYPNPRPRFQSVPWSYAYPRYYPPREPAQVPQEPDVKQTPKAPSQNQVSDIQAMKEAFVGQLLPHVQSTNRKLNSQRMKLVELTNALSQGRNLTPSARQWLSGLAKKYRLKPGSEITETTLYELLKRVDIIPPSLALAQAANESAWGRSRFATEANNLFGIWTYDEDKGLIPEKRDDSQTHLVRKFEDHAQAVQHYIHLLNTHPAYNKLREIRANSRGENRLPEGHLLAEGLQDYSAKGDEYIKLIQQLIRQNQWAQLDQSNLNTG